MIKIHEALTEIAHYVAPMGTITITTASQGEQDPLFTDAIMFDDGIEEEGLDG
jgi:hypothetical protein